MLGEEKPASGGRKKILWILLGVLVLIIIGGAGGTAYYFYSKYQKVIKNPETVTKQESEWLVEKAGKLVDLPKDETPSVATVIDKEKLKDQPFFANSENGDKVLIFTKAKKAILYRPSTDKVIEIMPLIIDENATTTTTTTKKK